MTRDSKEISNESENKGIRKTRMIQNPVLVFKKYTPRDLRNMRYICRSPGISGHLSEET